ncbi:hypothetical protein [Anabaena sp. UHCC 0253]|uniref:hypothetical protein n=1 Tax=Anabaena sp. UHCC 0253 TaxID=2590019 RepID=UPI00158024D0|nr:hypothetical protein [Anabaena sp. UHCC 0253]
MKVVEETKTRLVIKHQPIANWFSGGILFIAGLSFWIYLIAFDFTSLRLTCKRSAPPEINCELNKFAFLGRIEKRKIFDPQQAYIQTKIGSKGSKNFQIIIVSKFGEFRLLPHVSYQDNEKFVIKFNSFINSNESLLILQQNQRSYLLFISLFILVITVTGASLATSSATTCTFYKSINKVCIERQGLRSKEIIEYPLEDIVNLHIQDKQVKYSRVYRAVIFLKNAKEISINPQYTDKKSVENVAARIRYFLKLEY